MASSVGSGTHQLHVMFILPCSMGKILFSLQHQLTAAMKCNCYYTACVTSMFVAHSTPPVKTIYNFRLPQCRMIWLCVFGGHGRGLRVFSGLCVDIWWLVHQSVIFAVLTVFWLFLTIGTLLILLVQWYSLGRRDNWYTDGHFCSFDCLLTVFDMWPGICYYVHNTTNSVNKHN